MSLMQMLTMVCMPAAPRPWMALPAMKAAKSSTKAQMRLPPKKMTFAISKIGFLPQISEIFPHDGVEVVWARTKEVPIQV